MVTLIQLKEAAGNAPWYVLNCYKCNGVAATSYTQDTRFNWALKLACSKCRSCWWVCKECLNQRTHIQTQVQFTRHNRNKHRTRQTTETTTTQTEEQKQWAVLNEDKKPTADVAVDSTFFSNPASLAYFRDSANGNAMNRLVHRAVSKKATPAGIPDPKDVAMIADLSFFVSKLTRGQCLHLSNTLRLCVMATQ